MTETSGRTLPLVGRVRRSLDQLRAELLSQRTPDEHWVGELSASSLSTATAVSAMAAFHLNSSTDLLNDTSKPSHYRSKEDTSNGSITVEKLVNAVTLGIDSLGSQQNGDGGFGDTDRSHSNIATSYLVLAASSLAKQAIGYSLPETQVRKLEKYIQRTGGFDALKQRYGTDKTFVVPILTNLAIAGLVPWDKVPALPFEAAAFPQSMYRRLQMPVVSYAIPALVAIGQTRHFHGRKAFLPLRLLRKAMIKRTLRVLERMQPGSGGFLEATPLTAFVVMSLAVTGRTGHQVAKEGLRFLLNSMDEQGRWPIDTNLATWVTSLSMHALSCDPEDDGNWCTEKLLNWHLQCQHLVRHPFTGAEPGGWGWSDLSGAVPDSDDTPAAILGLVSASRWNKGFQSDIHQGIEKAVAWLDRLQNKNGGWPTFCRGWGKLPFDRSSNDLTAHALRAIKGAADLGITNLQSKQVKKARHFLMHNQESDGSWLPLWFGNQDRADESNPIYGTSKVLAAAVHFLDETSIDQGCDYLLSNQNHDGGWGGGSSVTRWLEKSGYPIQRNAETDAKTGIQITSSMEETALAVDALITIANFRNMAVALHPHSDKIDHPIPSQPMGAKRGSKTKLGSDSEPPDPEHPSPTQPNVPRETSRQVHDHLESSDQYLPNSGGMTVKVPAETAEKSPQRGFTEESCSLSTPYAGKDALSESIIRGVEFLVDSLEAGRHNVAWPIGFYFAKLWYHEKLYPHIFTASALGKFLRISSESADSEWPL